MAPRRALLLVAVFVFAALSARRAHANRDPSELEGGGSLGAHDATLTCGPTAHVRTASGGFHYDRVFESEGRPPGEGASLDVRAAIGSTTIVQVGDRGFDKCTAPGGLCPNQSEQIYAANADRSHFLGSAQMSGGWDFGTVAIAGGVGYFGLAEIRDNQFHSKYWPLPSVEARVGRRTRGWSLKGGLGAPPIAGMARWYSTYAIASYRFKEGGEIGAGVMGVVVADLDKRNGLLFKGAVPITDWATIGGFGVIGAANNDLTSTAFNWTAGASMTFTLDAIGQ